MKVVLTLCVFRIIHNIGGTFRGILIFEDSINSCVFSSFNSTNLFCNTSQKRTLKLWPITACRFRVLPIRDPHVGAELYHIKCRRWSRDNWTLILWKMRYTRSGVDMVKPKRWFKSSAHNFYYMNAGILITSNKYFLITLNQQRK